MVIAVDGAARCLVPLIRHDRCVNVVFQLSPLLLLWRCQC